MTGTPRREVIQLLHPRVDRSRPGESWAARGSPLISFQVASEQCATTESVKIRSDLAHSGIQGGGPSDHLE
ncbi:hypothetical protein HMPREF9153_0445 [Cutibacterium avidum ATCC 25577]|uniref:Uncharacterized protein n=1 Tax=Cutibacterium avidum ATCC 25577 TaxID=997355 RepID=G4CV88_9ACTN|nr:hypothetical protein HMPREF9153_0445 [Cutibacterium avidum ATCC 25577]